MAVIVSKTGRNLTIDVAKGIGILLVVLVLATSIVCTMIYNRMRAVRPFAKNA